MGCNIYIVLVEGVEEPYLFTFEASALECAEVAKAAGHRVRVLKRYASEGFSGNL